MEVSFLLLPKTLLLKYIVATLNAIWTLMFLVLTHLEEKGLDCSGLYFSFLTKKLL